MSEDAMHRGGKFAKADALACYLALQCLASIPGLSQPSIPSEGIRPGGSATSISPEGKIIRTVIAEGFGSDIDNASRNAAENALKEVVGSFIDSEKQLERHSQIVEGVRSETRNITSKVREYSQGSISSFEVLKATQDGTIMRVAARVGVRIEDFKAYIRKFAAGENTIVKPIVPHKSINQQQMIEKSAIFLDRIIKPIADNDGVSLEVGRFEPLTIDHWRTIFRDWMSSDS
jgi:hypothetical protein